MNTEDLESYQDIIDYYENSIKIITDKANDEGRVLSSVEFKLVRFASKEIERYQRLQDE